MPVSGACEPQFPAVGTQVNITVLEDVE